MERPRLKANFASSVAGDRVFRVAENRHFMIYGPGLATVLEYLDGRHTVGQIAQAVEGRLSLIETLSAIRKFEAFGQLADGRPNLDPDEIAYWDALEVDPAAAAQAIGRASIAVVALDGTAAPPVLAALEADGFRATVCTVEEAATRDDALVVALVDDYLHPGLDRLDAALAPGARRWLPAKASSRGLWLGPLMERGRTGCWACLAQRLDANRQVRRYLRTRWGEEKLRIPAARRAAGPLVLGGLLATEVATIIATGASPNLDGKLITLELGSLASDTHELIRRPQCPRCGEASLITERDPKITITCQPAREDVDGGLRIQPAGVLADRMRKHISPLIGAITWLTAFDEVDNGLTYTYRAGHNFAMIGDNLDLLRRNLRGQSGGKGRSDVQARMSALGEAIERYSGVWRGDEPVHRASYADLGPDLAIHPEEILLFSERQYEHRRTWNADPAHRLHVVPERLRADRPIDWTAGWSLSQDRVRYVPSAHTWYGHPDVDHEFFCYSDSNGNAAGGCVEEAIVQGFCELVERDAVAVWWYNRLRRPAFDLDALDDPYVDRLRTFYADQGRSVWVLDITTDLGIPTFVAVSRRVDHPVQDVLVGFGAHLDAHTAVARALIELNQFLPAVRERDADGNAVYVEDDVATLDWLRTTRTEDEPWLVPAHVPAMTPADYPGAPITDMADAVQLCVERAGRAGLEVVVADQTQPDLDLSVVKVIVPGMRHFWRRLGPGRIYTVPVEMGWQTGPTLEDGLNPKSVFF